MTPNFSGPLFIVGMPRSGTKLVRSLVNNSPEISIPPAESLFIPHFVSKHRLEEPILTAGLLGRIFRDLQQTTFFMNMQREGIVLPRETLASLAGEPSSWEVIFGFILRFYTRACKPAAIIWGDKSPSYRMHLPLLKQIFPAAKFLHMIRDPRDYALSVRRAWGKSALRAADQWQEQVQYAAAAGKAMGADYLEIRYEALLEQPGAVLQNVFAFLGTAYEPTYLTLQQPSENLGEAAGKAEILSSNTGKYAMQMKPAARRRIEEITLPTAAALGYAFDSSVQHRPLSPVSRAILKGYDGLAALRFHLQEKGLKQGIRYFRALRKTRQTGEPPGRVH